MLGQSVVASPVSGTVTVETPGSATFTPLTSPQLILVGSTVDTTLGTVQLDTATTVAGQEQTGTFDGGAFVVTQAASGLTDLQLAGGPSTSVCGAGARAAFGPLLKLPFSSTVLRTLHSRVRGNFRTTGGYAAATVRGTEWTTADTCTGTMFSDQTGSVDTAARTAPLSKVITPNETIEYECSTAGMPPLASGYCEYLFGTVFPGVGGAMATYPYQASLATRSRFRVADECITDPAQRVQCTAYPFSGPGPLGYRAAGAVCNADDGPGEYLVSFRLGGITIGATPLTYTVPTQGRMGLCGTVAGAYFPTVIQPGAPRARIAANVKIVSRYQVPTRGRAYGMQVDLAPTGKRGSQQLRGVLYRDRHGRPGALVAVTPVFTFKSSDAGEPYDLFFRREFPLSPGFYWVGVITGQRSGVAGFIFQQGARDSDFNPNNFTAGASNPFGPFHVGNVRLAAEVGYDVPGT